LLILKVQITLQNLSSTALDTITLSSDSAEVVFTSGPRAYSYDLNLGDGCAFASAQDVADEIANAPSSGAAFNKLVRDGVLTAV
jgi:hypothetical protein